jgi:hypothetical protein
VTTPFPNAVYAADATRKLNVVSARKFSCLAVFDAGDAWEITQLV